MPIKLVFVFYKCKLRSIWYIVWLGVWHVLFRADEYNTVKAEQNMDILLCSCFPQFCHQPSYWSCETVINPGQLHEVTASWKQDNVTSPPSFLLTPVLLHSDPSVPSIIFANMFHSTKSQLLTKAASTPSSPILFLFKISLYLLTILLFSHYLG